MHYKLLALACCCSLGAVGCFLLTAQPVFDARTVVEFAAAHLLREYDGPCSRNHGHNYKVELVVRGEKLDGQRMLQLDRRALCCLGHEVEIFSDEVDGQVAAF